MVTKIHTYKELYLMTVEVRYDGSCQVPYNGISKYHIRDVINKMACYYPYNQGNLVMGLYEATDKARLVPVAGNLYFAKECKTNRDVFRNSGYSIVRDPDKADVIVTPNVRADFFYNMRCNIVAKDEAKDELYLVSIDKSGYPSGKYEAADVIAVRKYLENVKGFTLDEAQDTDLVVWFLPKCEVFEDVLNSVYGNRLYCQESKIPIKASTNICPETLVFWENMSDMNLLTRTMCTSDWREYPITTLVFMCLKAELPNSSFNGYYNSDFRNLTSTIDYSSWQDLKNNLYGKSITPKDYEMLQSYIFFRTGIDENGSVIDQNKFNSIPEPLRNMLQYRVAVRPFKLSTRTSIDNLKKVVV